MDIRYDRFICYFVGNKKIFFFFFFQKFLLKLSKFEPVVFSLAIMYANDLVCVYLLKIRQLD